VDKIAAGLKEQGFKINSPSITTSRGVERLGVAAVKHHVEIGLLGPIRTIATDVGPGNIKINLSRTTK
jgi:hypothetical protein